nr:30S ribosomal protein S10, chloroplastic [Ipomoea batatas]
MAISSSSLSASVFSVCNCNSSAISAKPKLSFTSLPPNCAKFQPLKTSRLSTSRILAAPEVLDSSADVTATQDEAAATSFPDVSFDSDKEDIHFELISNLKGNGTIGYLFYLSAIFQLGLELDMRLRESVFQVAPKHKIRIKLRSYWVPLIEDSCKQIMDAARNTNAKTMGPVPLPTKKRIYCVLKSPHVDKDARFHFEIRTHQRLIDILYPTAQTIDSLMQLDLPAGVDVEVKL